MIEPARSRKLSFDCQLVKPRLSIKKKSFLQTVCKRRALFRNPPGFQTNLEFRSCRRLFIASAPTTVISFGVKSKLITVLALHLSAFWLFSFLQSCHHLFLTSGPTVITSCHWHQTTTGGKFYSRFCTFETWDPVFWKFPFRTNYKMKLTWSLQL